METRGTGALPKGECVALRWGMVAKRILVSLELDPCSSTWLESRPQRPTALSGAVQRRRGPVL